MVRLFVFVCTVCVCGVYCFVSIPGKIKNSNKKRKYCKAFSVCVTVLLIGIICFFSLYLSFFLYACAHGMQHTYIFIYIYLSCILSINSSIIKSKQFKLVYDVSFSGVKVDDDDDHLALFLFMLFFFVLILLRRIFSFVSIEFFNANLKKSSIDLDLNHKVFFFFIYLF